MSHQQIYKFHIQVWNCFSYTHLYELGNLGTNFIYQNVQKFIPYVLKFL
jgi:hypothetical protein